MPTPKEYRCYQIEIHKFDSAFQGFVETVDHDTNLTEITSPTGSDSYIFNQIKEAFRKPPDISGIYQGQRRIKQGSPNRRTALFPSRKAGGTIPLESKLELAYAIELERNSETTSYRTQSVKILLPKNKFAIPDFLVEKRDGSFEFHEIKPSIENLTFEQNEKISDLKATLHRSNIIYKVIDSKSLKSGITLDKLLTLYSRSHVLAWTTREIEAAINLLHNQKVGTEESYEILIKNHLNPRLADYLRFHSEEHED